MTGIGGIHEDIHGEGALSHAGPRGQDNKLASLEPVEHSVEVDESGGNPEDSGPACLVGAFKLVDGLIDKGRRGF